MRLLELLGKEVRHHSINFIEWWKRVLPSGKTTEKWATKKWIIISVLGVMTLGVLSVVGLIGLTYFGAFGSLPSQEELLRIDNHNASEVYSADGQLIGRYFIENRTDALIEEVSPYVQYALIATEDARFMEHEGVDMRAAARVVWKSILLGQEEYGGGSTLSQQLAKNLYPRERYRFFSMPINKLREMFIARRLEKVYSKEGLLNLYLNTVPFSRNIYGIKVATDQFFSTTPDELKVEEAAVLIGMLKGTTSYDPVAHPERSQARRNVVMQQMQRYGYLEQAAVDSLSELPIELKFNKQQKQSKAPYFQEHIKSTLNDILANTKKRNGDAYSLFTDGLKIYTTVDADLQQYAEAAVSKHMKKLQTTFDKHWKNKQPWKSDKVLERAVQQSARYKAWSVAGYSEEVIDSLFQQPVNMIIFDWEKGQMEQEMSPLDSVKFYISLLHAGFLAAEPQSGQIKAWVGGIDYAYFQYDHVKSRRQVGSTFKPIVYAQAIRQGIAPCNYFQNTLVSYPKWDDWQPRNSDGQYGGFYSMSGGLSKSINTITVEVLFQTGIDPVRKLATEMGINSDIPEGPAIALGAMEGSLYEMIQVYSTFANRGKHQPLYYIEKIEDANGNILYEHEKEEAKSILEESDADLMNEMLQMVVDSGTARRLQYHYGLRGDIAGKTGTTQNQSDGWFIGYNPNLVAGAWVGADLPIVRFRSLSLGQGASTALPIWGEFMRKIYKSKAPSDKTIRTAKFASLSAIEQERINCDPFLSDDILDFDLLEEEAERGSWLRDLFGGQDQAFDIENYEDGVSPEELQELEQQMDKARRKQDRKDKLKNLWSKKLFGGGKKEESAKGEDDGG
ncbi:MAG: transglycosylase domain-containing protein [Bacteroidota bacterium]